MTFNLTICPHIEEVHLTQSIINSGRSLILLKIGKLEESETGLFQIKDDRWKSNMFTRVGMWSLSLSVFRRNSGHCFSLPLHPSANAVLHTQIPCSCPLESPPHLLLDPRVKTCHLSIEILSTHHVPESIDCSRFLNKSQSSRVCGDLSFLNNKSQSFSCKKNLRPFLLEDNGWCPSQKSRIMVPGDLWGKKFWNPWLQEVSLGLSGWGRI